MSGALMQANGDIASAFDPDDERSVIGFILCNPEAAAGTSAETLERTHFSDPLSLEVFLAIGELQAIGVRPDAVSVTGFLRRADRLSNVGGAAAVQSLTEPARCCSSSNLDYQISRLRDKSAQRLLLSTQEWATAASLNGTPAAELAEGLEARARKIRDIADADQAAAVPRVEFLTPSQVRAFDPPDGWNLVGDFHIQQGGPFVIGGAPGVGKSRAATALAVAGATGADWFGLPVHRRFRTMILQAENGRRRLKDEYSVLDLPIFDEFIRVCPPPPFGFSFNDPLFCAQLRAAIEEFRPDVFIIDPWNRATSDDKSKDYLETFRTLQALLPTGDKAPALGIVAHTRKPGQGERTNGRALLNILAGGYALGSVPRSAFIIQHASDDTEESQVVFTCCKNNDGKEGPRSAWVRGNGLFQPVEGFNWDEFDGPPEKRRVVAIEDIEAIFSDGEKGWFTIPRGEAVDRLMERTKLSRTTCYTALESTGKFKARLKEKDKGITLK